MDFDTWWVWMLLAAVFLGIEIFRSKTPFIWLSLSAAITGILALLDIEIAGQAAVFLNLSGFLILLEKRFNEKYVFKKSVYSEGGYSEPGEKDDRLSENVFRKAGPGWEIRYGGKSYSVKHSIGLDHIRNLINNQGQWIHASELKRMVSSENTDPKYQPYSDLGKEGLGDQNLRFKDDINYEEVIDRLPLNKIKELKEDLEGKKEADDFAGPEERTEQLELLEFITKYISGVTDNKGRSRKLYDDAETDRKNVSAAVNRAKKTFLEHPEFYTHFQSFIKAEGHSFRYLPDRPIDWLTE
ncbi:MAG: NfeD family protein [bacterium]|nr:NfeD family protein [bacterium]